MEGGLPLALWLPGGCALAGLVAGLLLDASGRPAASVSVIAAGLAAAGGSGFWLATTTAPGVGAGVLAYGGGFSALGGLVYSLAAVAVTAGHRRMRERERGPGISVVLALAAVFSQALLSSLDVLVTLVALSGLAVAGYALVAGAGTRQARESSVRYAVQGVVATGLSVYGLAIVFALAGGETAYFAATEALAAVEPRTALLALGLVVMTFAFKLGAFPFHAWVPDAYEHADPPVTAFLASGTKVAAVVALLVLVRGSVFATGGFAPSTNLLVALGVGSLLFGAFGMLRQRSAARLLGYSGIAQVGYALLAIASGSAGVQASVVFVVTYAMGVCVAYVSLEAAGRVSPSWRGDLGSLAGLSRRSPLAAGSLAVALLSLTGIPLFAGFWGKLSVFAALLEADSLLLAVIAGLAAVVSFGGYGSIIRAAFFDEPRPADALSGEAASTVGEVDERTGDDERGGSATAVAVLGAVLLVAIGVAPLVFGMSRVFGIFSL